MLRNLKLVVFVPDSHLAELKQAIFSAGAGRLGNYDSCSWQALGEGQFQPLSGSTPYLGSKNKIEKVQEWRLETLVQEKALKQVITALRTSHPYEEPAFDLMPLYDSKL